MVKDGSRAGLSVCLSAYPYQDLNVELDCDYYGRWLFRRIKQYLIKMTTSMKTISHSKYNSS